ncbi:hypothetical protein [Indioceanicola profundi]|uniref:hypothetical protein n=1 Tax=Indioceanicola profundi TaxID=2220096 RepID=UPI000E6AC4B0|nr:hypothetical protein [Indioceanicola profundi]
MPNDQKSRPEERPAEKHTGQGDKPGAGAQRTDMDHTPGDGTLQGATPAGLTADELRKRAEDTDRTSEPGTG